MNLIEQLGGYEKANAEYKGVKHLRDSAEVERGRVVFAIGILRQDLLEYRRQHNIFEDGDYVVKTNPKIKHAHVRVVISTSPSGGAVLDYQGFPYKFPCIRHATPEEIKAGHRIDHFVDINDMGDDTHIENHISKNCKVIETQAEKLLGLRDENAELQKRVDAVKRLAQTLWEKSNEKHKQGKVWESKTLGECADEILDELEQALKGAG